jgi:phage terminase large subunit GpA-like protein
VIFIKGSQLGATESGFNWIGYSIDVVPCAIMYLMPTIDTMERNVKARIDPMISSTPRLNEKVGMKRSRDGGNTLKQKDYPGGVLYLSGANSAASLASIPVRFVIYDEIDRYPDDVDGEGSPIALAEKRQSTFGSRKKTYKLSTPTIKGMSKIESAFLKTDQRYYFVPCPHCKEKQVLQFASLKWEKGKYDAVHYECQHCSGKIYNRHKTWMLARGEWVATQPALASRERVGYHLSSMYSPDGWLSWEQIAQEWDEAQGDEPRIKTFVNTVLGETYEEKSDAPQWESLYDRSQNEGIEANKPLDSVVFVTAGADVQADRIEVEIVGWQPGRSSQQIDYRVIMGDPDKKDVWQALTGILNETWVTADGRTLPIRLMAVDTGYKTSVVHDFAKKHGVSRVIPIKGQEALQVPFSPPRAVQITKAGKKIGNMKVWHVGVSYLKSQLYGWLRQEVDRESGEIPDGYCLFSPRDPHYFRGLTAESVQVVRNKKGYIQHVWVKKYERNEPLDCRVYATAAAYVLGFERWSTEKWQREKDMAPKLPVPVEEKAKTKSASKPKRQRPGGGYWDK